MREILALGKLFHVDSEGSDHHEDPQLLLTRARADLERAAEGGGWDFAARLDLARALLVGATGRAAEAERLLEDGFKTYRSVFKSFVKLHAALAEARDRFRLDHPRSLGADTEAGEIDPERISESLDVRCGFNGLARRR